eukprot:660911_1
MATPLENQTIRITFKKLDSVLHKQQHVVITTTFDLNTQIKLVKLSLQYRLVRLSAMGLNQKGRAAMPKLRFRGLSLQTCPIKTRTLSSYGIRDGDVIYWSDPRRHKWNPQKMGYNPNVIKDDTLDTYHVVRAMGGQADSGDSEDHVQYSLDCKVYHLSHGKYVEYGKGILQLNLYETERNEGEECGEDATDKVRGRILCRRHKTYTTLINAPISKRFAYEKTKCYVRICVVQEAQMKTYLIKPKDKAQVDILLNKIKEIQGMLQKSTLN